MKQAMPSVMEVFALNKISKRLQQAWNAEHHVSAAQHILRIHRDVSGIASSRADQMELTAMIARQTLANGWEGGGVSHELLLGWMMKKR